MSAPVLERAVREQPAFDLGLERVVLGSMMLDRSVIDPVTRLLESKHFYHPAHRQLFEIIVELFEFAYPTEPIALSAHPGVQRVLEKVGDTSYLHTLVSSVTAGDATWYAGEVRKLAYRREVDEFAIFAAQLAQMRDLAPDAIAERLRDRMEGLTAAPGADEPTKWAELIQPGMDAIEGAADASAARGIATGLHDLDRLLTGLYPGELVVCAGRPGVGKSILLANLARTAALDQKRPTMLATLEMKELEVFNRLVSAECAVPLTRLRTGDLEDSDWTRIARLVGDTAEAPLWIDYCPGVTLAQIRAKARRMKQAHGLDLLLVDYLQQIVTTGNSPRHEQVSALSRGLKLLAQELEIAVVVAAQLNRGSEQRSNKRPMMSDLRESGSIEADADVVILVHRDDYYDKESPRAGEVDLIVDKSRNGATDTIVVAGQLHLSRFASLAV